MYDLKPVWTNHTSACHIDCCVNIKSQTQDFMLNMALNFIRKWYLLNLFGQVYVFEFLEGFISQVTHQWRSMGLWRLGREVKFMPLLLIFPEYFQNGKPKTNFGHFQKWKKKVLFSFHTNFQVFNVYTALQHTLPYISLFQYQVDFSAPPKVAPGAVSHVPPPLSTPLSHTPIKISFEYLNQIFPILAFPSSYPSVHLWQLFQRTDT